LLEDELEIHSLEKLFFISCGRKSTKKYPKIKASVSLFIERPERVYWENRLVPYFFETVWFVICLNGKWDCSFVSGCLL